MSRPRKQVRPEKEAIVAEIKADLDRTSFVLMTDFTGLNMARTLDLRSRLRKAGGRYRVVRNRLLRQAARDPAMTDAVRDLAGATGMVTGEGDGIEVARALLGFVKENERPVVKGGVFDGRAIGPQDVRALGDLPTKPVLQSMLLGVLSAPMTQLAGVLQQKVSSLVYVLKAVEEKKAGASAAPTEA